MENTIDITLQWSRHYNVIMPSEGQLAWAKYEFGQCHRVTAAASRGERRTSGVRTVPEGRLVVCAECVERTISWHRQQGARNLIIRFGQCRRVTAGPTS